MVSVPPTMKKSFKTKGKVQPLGSSIHVGAGLGEHISQGSPAKQSQQYIHTHVHTHAPPPPANTHTLF